VNNWCYPSNTNKFVKVLIGPVTRLRAKRFKKAFNGLLQDTWATMDFKNILNNDVQALINLIHAQERRAGEHSYITKKLE
jgi:hypothetical protein